MTHDDFLALEARFGRPLPIRLADGRNAWCGIADATGVEVHNGGAARSRHQPPTRVSYGVICHVGGGALFEARADQHEPWRR